MSAACRPSRAERRAVARPRRQFTPEASTHRAYLQEGAAYVAECRAASPRLVHDGRVGRVTELEVRRSRLFGRRYLVAYVERSWYRAVAPTSDAIASTLSGVDALPPLVILPHRRRHERDGRIGSIIEHEFVHINQAMLGRLQPSPHGSAAERLANLFFTRLRSEFEAHLLQLARWPELFPRGLGLSLEHWCVLRAYTDALEAMFVAGWRGEFRPRDLTTFLDHLPRRFRRWLDELRVGHALASWFRRHLVLHVAVTLRNLARTRASFGKSAVFRAGQAWVGSAAFDDDWKGRDLKYLVSRGTARSLTASSR